MQQGQETEKLKTTPENSLDRQLSLSYLRLVEMVDNKPKSIGSGCIVKCNNRFIMLTVQQVMRDGAPLHLELKYIPEKGARLKPLGGFTYVEPPQKIKSPEDFEKYLQQNTNERLLQDVAIKDITNEIDEYKAFLQDTDFESYPGKIMSEEPKTIFETDFSKTPKKGNEYFFAGLTKPEIFDTPHQLYGFQRTETKESLIFEEQDELFYKFSVPAGHRGHKVYEGCSGAPIMDKEGNIISLVSWGNTDNNTLYGINLFKIGVLIKAMIETGLEL